MTVSLASIEDCREILELQRLAYRQEAELYNDFNIPPLTQTLEEIQHEFLESTVFKITVDKIIIASIRTRYNEGIGLIGRVIVHPEYQNNGLGTLLMAAIESYSRINNIKRFQLFTGDKSIKNLYLYKKLGFREFKRATLSEKVNLVYLEKKLSK